MPAAVQDKQTLVSLLKANSQLAWIVINKKYIPVFTA